MKIAKNISCKLHEFNATIVKYRHKRVITYDKLHLIGRQDFRQH